MSIKPGPIANPELADKILEAIYKEHELINTEELSKRLAIDQSEIIKIIYAINNSETLIQTFKGKGNGDMIVGQYQKKDMEVELFLKSGGFTAYSKNNQQEIQSQKERSNLELEHLKLEIANLQQLPSEQKRTRRLSIIAILVSLSTILFEILKTLFLKP